MQQMIKPFLGNETVYGCNISAPQRLSQMLHLKVVGTKEKERDKCTTQRNGSIVLLQKGVVGRYIPTTKPYLAQFHLV